MEEELNEHELEERFYSMLHYVDESQANVENNQNALKIVESAPRSTLRRYWKGSDHNTQAVNTAHQKINLKETPNMDKPKPKEEKSVSPKTLPPHLSIFQTPVAQNIKKSIEIIENDEEYSRVVELESSDEDEVVEVALPPKPTITIESSDDDDVNITDKVSSKDKVKPTTHPASNVDREVSASPVPSVVSSMSDEFIRGDCIALNISSRRPDDHSFDFSLHGADLLGQNTPSKKKKRKKNKENMTSTPIVADSTPDKVVPEGCFATPKSKAKNKRQRTKLYSVSDKSIPNADVYDSDSNQSTIDLNKSNTYQVTEKSLPSFDVYESDSNPSELIQDTVQLKSANANVDISGSGVEKSQPDLTKTSKRNHSSVNNETTITIDLTDNSYVDAEDIHENIVIGNVTGFTESDDYEDNIPKNDGTALGSTKVPAILYENLDFDNLKGKDKVCKNRRYSLTTLRAEMEKFYNESWGGEDFNHREIQKSMSRDKSLWAIDPKDRMPGLSKRRLTCNYCNRAGHRDEACRLKPPVCYMCGHVGHVEPRCPRKICVNCGSPNHMYSTMCRNCSHWGRIACAECGQNGHPASHCPDLWRRYHNTLDYNQLEENHLTKGYSQTYCSGCTRRGHLIHTCRFTLPFSGLPINSPYVNLYRPVFAPPVDTNAQNNNHINNQQRKTISQDSTISSATTPTRMDRNKRQSKSPTVHDTHPNKKRNVTEANEVQGNKSLVTLPQRKVTQSKEVVEVAKEPEKTTSANSTPQSAAAPEKALDFIPIGGSPNHDKKGQIIQDNEVSDTSDVVTSARIYVTQEIIEKLKTKSGEEWLKETTEKLNVMVENSDVHSYLNIKGSFGDQESFQAALRDWSKPKSSKENSKSDTEADITQDSPSEVAFPSNNIPKNKNNVLRKLSKALDSLKEDLGEPNALYKELNFLQNKQEQLLKQKVINPKQVSNNRDNINDMLKKLNMVLLGQAGLADGTTHLNELYSLQEKLINFRQKNISKELRKEIGEHYHSIFTATQRDDYGELLKSYYGSKKSPTVFKKKENPIKLSPKKKFNAIPTPHNKGPGFFRGGGDIVNTKNPFMRKVLVEKTMKKLVFYHRRLMNARPIDSVLKKTKVDLVRKLHSQIASVGGNGSVTSKTLKKIKKLQDHAQVLLNNV